MSSATDKARSALVAIRHGTRHDLDAAVDAAARMSDESTYEGLEFVPWKAGAYLSWFIDGDDKDMLIVDVDGEPMGGALVAVADEFHSQPFCYVCKFWILPEGRRTPAGRTLRDAIADWARKRGCSHIFCTGTAGIDDMQQFLFKRLMQAAGYKVAGPVMMLALTGE